MNIRQLLDERISTVLTALGAPPETSAIIKPSARPEFGDYQANGVMAAAKHIKINPIELANRVVERLDLSDMAHQVEIAGPGFINIHLRNDWLATQCEHVLRDTRLAIPIVSQPQRIVVDYSAPNLAKEMHVGHLRSTIIGDAVARILEFQGHQVIRQNHVGDWGTQFGMLLAHMASLREQGQVLSMQLADLETFYRQAKQRFDADANFADSARDYVVKLQSGDTECLALWQQFIAISLQHCEELYERLGVSLKREHVMAESAYNDDLPKIISLLQEQGLLAESNGAKCVFLAGFKNKNDEALPVIVQKQDGGYLYATTDLAAARYRSQQLQADRVLYFVDVRQSLHFQQIFALARLAGLAHAGMSMEHMAFGTMLGADNKPFKTREGGVVKLADLLTEAVERAYALVSERSADLPESERQAIADKIGIAAVKYADLSKHRQSDYLFSWDSMLAFEGNTAPYLLYAYARLETVFCKAFPDGDRTLLAIPSVQLEQPIEHTLAVKLLQLEDVLESVTKEGTPHQLCSYLYDVASLSMAFYESCPILKAGVTREVRNSRLHLAHLTAKTLQTGLSLLGISVLDRM